MLSNQFEGIPTSQEEGEKGGVSPHTPILQIVVSSPPNTVGTLTQENDESRVSPIIPTVDFSLPVSSMVEETEVEDDSTIGNEVIEAPGMLLLNVGSTAHSADMSSHKLEEDISVTLGEDERNTEQQPQLSNNEIQPETNNPFDFDIVPNKNTKTLASKTNPFAYDSDSDQLVAAICVELGCEEGKQEETEGDGDDMSDEGNSRTWRTSLPIRYNPFDIEGETEDANDIETLTRQQQRDESSVPLVLNNVSRFRHQVTTPSSSSSTKSIHTFSKKYAQEVHELQLWGFDYSFCAHALMHTHGNVDQAKQMMVTHLLDDSRLISNVQSWTSPVMVRVGGWLPNIQGDIGTDTHTAYFISVTMTLGNESWRVGHRYSEFWSFYCAVYPRICQAMSQGMKNEFPSDRLSSWLGHTLGVDMEGFNDNRMKMLDAWLKELCNHSLIMLDEDTRTKVYDFLQVNENLARLHRFRQNVSGVHGNINNNYYNNNNNTSNNNNNSNHVFSSTNSSGSKSTSFRTRNSTDTVARTTTTATNSSSLCCTFSIPMKTTHEVDGLVMMGTPIHGTSVIENQNHLEVDMNSPDMVALINRRKAAIASQQNDDSAARGHDHHHGTTATIRTNKRRELNSG